jgi:hypothetical protein
MGTRKESESVSTEAIEIEFGRLLVDGESFGRTFTNSVGCSVFEAAGAIWVQRDLRVGVPRLGPREKTHQLELPSIRCETGRDRSSLRMRCGRQLRGYPYFKITAKSIEVLLHSP